MTKYIKNPSYADDHVVIQGYGAVRDGDVIEGDFEEYVPRLLVHAPAEVVAADPVFELVVAKKPDTLPAPADPTPSPDETQEISPEIMGELVKESKEPKSGKKKGK